MATKLLTGREALIYYHHEIAVLAVSAGLLSLLREPVLPYLDITALWLGVFLACGRIGCLSVGCCHGKPHHWGVRYSDEHAAAGFASYYVGVPLFPVQVLEALMVLLIVGVCSLLVVGGRAPGTALSTYVVVYSTARIWLEELRGDSARPYWGRFSEAQWTSLALIATAMLSEWQGRLPVTQWHMAIALCAVLSMVLLALHGRARRAVLQPSHAGEIASILRSNKYTDGAVSVHRTSLSIGISTQPLALVGDGPATLYSLSRTDPRLRPIEALALARLIARLARPGAQGEVLDSHRGVFHVILRDTPR
jgi:hypothetical protein